MKDAVIIVTGGGRGIGRAICGRFARSGAQVVAASRSEAEIEQTRQGIEAEGGKCFPCRTDVTSTQDVARLIQEVVDRFGRVDVVVNCAGVAELGTVAELSDEQFDRMLSVNVTGVYRVCRAVWDVMKRQGGGTIVNISSAASVDPFPGFAAYGASKSWVNAWTKGLAQEGSDSGIRVFAVAPGAVETQMLRGAFPDFPDHQALAPEEVAERVFEVARPDSKSVSGETIFVNK